MKKESKPVWCNQLGIKPKQTVDTVDTVDNAYLELLAEVLYEGIKKEGRNGITTSTFGKTLVVDDLIEGNFPILHIRKMFPDGVLGELDAFINGAQSVKEFEAHGCNYWKTWADEEGHLDLDYGRAWTSWPDGKGGVINQLANLIGSLTEDPNSRRHIVTGWNPANLDSLSLPCCHMLYQWYVNGDTLEMIWYQRSVDMMVGLPSDIISAAAWNILIAQRVGLKPGKLTFMLGDCHIYAEHEDQAKDLLHDTYHSKASHTVTKYKYNPIEGDMINAKTIKLVDYTSLPAIKLKLKA